MHVYGNHPEAVITLLKARRENPGAYPERKLGLIVEGGGMRGVLSAGSLLAVDLLGFRECFDEIYATSAGSVNAAYFVSGQGELGITVYFDDISNRTFFNPLRLYKMLDVEFVYDHIVPKVKPLDEVAIRRSKTKLFLSVTDVETGRNVLVDTHSCPDPVHTVLKASSALPILYNRTVMLDGRRYIDGGASDSLMVGQAIERGCTDILILLTKPAGYVSHPPSCIRKAIFYLLMAHRYPSLMATYTTLHQLSNTNRQFAMGEEQVAGINIATVCPDEAELIVGRTTTYRPTLLEGAHGMAKKVFDIFDGNKDKLQEVFHRYR